MFIITIFEAHQHKAAGRKTRLDIQNYGCNGNYFLKLLLLLFYMKDGNKIIRFYFLCLE